MKTMAEIEERWRKDAKESGASCWYCDIFKELYVTMNPDEPLVMFSKRTSWGADGYQRHDFGKTWNEVLQDPKHREYITQRFIDGGMDAENAACHLFDEEDLFWSDYPREVTVY